MGTIKTVNFSLSVAAGSTGLFVSRNIGFPFRISRIILAANDILDVNRRVRFFVSIDRDTTLITSPSGTNLFAAGGGDVYLLPLDRSVEYVLNQEIPHYDRYLKVQFANGSIDPVVVSGSFILEDILKKPSW